MAVPNVEDTSQGCFQTHMFLPFLGTDMTAQDWVYLVWAVTVLPLASPSPTSPPMAD